MHVLKTHTMVAIFGEEILDPKMYDPLGLNEKIRRKRNNPNHKFDGYSKNQLN